jgi:hypothetical protein
LKILGLLEREISKNNCRGIVGGYFNMVENPSYKCFACKRMLSRRERMVYVGGFENNPKRGQTISI